MAAWPCRGGIYRGAPLGNLLFNGASNRGHMKKIGILGVDELTAQLVRQLFLAAPDAQVFLSPGQPERINALAMDFPCWTMADNQAVIDEAELLLVSWPLYALPELASQIRLRPAQMLIYLTAGLPAAVLRQIFRHDHCVIMSQAPPLAPRRPDALAIAPGTPIQQIFALLNEMPMLIGGVDTIEISWQATP